MKLRTAYPYGLYEKIEDNYKKQSLFQLNIKLINHLPNFPKSTLFVSL